MQKQTKQYLGKIHLPEKQLEKAQDGRHTLFQVMGAEECGVQMLYQNKLGIVIEEVKKK